MTIPVWVEQTNGKFTASVPGASHLCATGGTREEALGALQAVITPEVERGALAFLDVENRGILALATGKFKDDPGWHQLWDDIAKEAYRYRDELKAQEFPE